MTTVTGGRLTKGMTARINGRWYTLTGDPRTVVLDGREWPTAREVQATYAKREYGGWLVTRELMPTDDGQENIRPRTEQSPGRKDTGHGHQ